MVGSAPNRPKRFPVVWNVFQRRNIHFVGRKQNIQEIEQALGQPKPKPQILAGGGGSGKTSLAVEYAYSHQESYDIVWWIRAETQATIVSDLAALAQRLARSGQTFDGPRQACNAALEQLRS